MFIRKKLKVIVLDNKMLSILIFNTMMNDININTGKSSGCCSSFELAKVHPPQ
ncbi:hypothetical protein Hdeb2414_s0590g00920421 [Helianthus debilis subsp. tardiflorus]